MVTYSLSYALFIESSSSDYDPMSTSSEGDRESTLQSLTSSLDNASNDPLEGMLLITMWHMHSNNVLQALLIFRYIAWTQLLRFQQKVKVKNQFNVNNKCIRVNHLMTMLMLSTAQEKVRLLFCSRYLNWMPL